MKSQITTDYLFRAASRVASKTPGYKAQAKPGWLDIKNQSAGKSEIYIHGVITPFAWFEDEVSASQILDQLSGIESDEIDVFINSEGGSVFEGVAIYNLLREKKAQVNVKIQALAASIASVVAMSGDHIEISEAALMMVHQASTFLYGNATDFEATAKLLRKIQGSISTTYARRTGLSKAEILAFMTADVDGTWFDAEEAVEHGFADSISEDAEMPEGAPENFLDFAVPPRAAKAASKENTDNATPAASETNKPDPAIRRIYAARARTLKLKTPLL